MLYTSLLSYYSRGAFLLGEVDDLESPQSPFSPAKMFYVLKWFGENETAAEKYTLRGRNDLHVFPNPTSGNVTVSSKSVNIKTISIIDIFGRTVMEKQADGANNVQLDLSKEAKGVYIIKTTSNTGILNIQKIVVN